MWTASLIISDFTSCLPAVLPLGAPLRSPRCPASLGAAKHTPNSGPVCSLSFSEVVSCKLSTTFLTLFVQIFAQISQHQECHFLLSLLPLPSLYTWPCVYPYMCMHWCLFSDFLPPPLILGCKHHHSSSHGFLFICLFVLLLFYCFVPSTWNSLAYGKHSINIFDWMKWMNEQVALEERLLLLMYTAKSSTLALLMPCFKGLSEWAYKWYFLVKK